MLRCIGVFKSNPVLIITSFGDVPDPLCGSVSTLFLDPEVSDSEAASSKDGNLKYFKDYEVTLT